MRIKERNAQRIRECVRAGTVKVVFNSMPVEFRADSVILGVGGIVQTLPNDFAWIFAGGTPPFDFLKKVGVGFGMRDMTFAARDEMQSPCNSDRQILGTTP
jgi:thioredoxin reductase